MYATVRRHGRCIVVTEEAAVQLIRPELGSHPHFSDRLFRGVGCTCACHRVSEDMPAIPLNSTLEATMIPSAEKVSVALKDLLAY
jgi:2-oxoisovalerate dehydrogenase E1 component